MRKSSSSFTMKRYVRAGQAQKPGQQSFQSNWRSCGFREKAEWEEAKKYRRPESTGWIDG